jgi:hypothetical protein
MSRKVVVVGVVACVLALVVSGLSLAQPPAGGQGGRGGRGPGGQFDPAQMRQRMMERLKEQLGADDASWKVLEPRLTKVMELNRQAGGGGFGRGMFFGGPRGQRGQRGDQGGQSDRQRPPGMENRELTAVEKAEQQLQTTLENQSAAPETIKAQLTAVRSEREKAKQALATAQQELRQILTVRQEAQLVLMGQLN